MAALQGADPAGGAKPPAREPFVATRSASGPASRIWAAAPRRLLVVERLGRIRPPHEPVQAPLNGSGRRRRRRFPFRTRPSPAGASPRTAGGREGRASAGEVSNPAAIVRATISSPPWPVIAIRGTVRVRLSARSRRATSQPVEPGSDTSITTARGDERVGLRQRVSRPSAAGFHAEALEREPVHVGLAQVHRVLGDQDEGRLRGSGQPPQRAQSPGSGRTVFRPKRAASSCSVSSSFMSATPIDSISSADSVPLFHAAHRACAFHQLAQELHERQHQAAPASARRPEDRRSSATATTGRAAGRIPAGPAARDRLGALHAPLPPPAKLYGTHGPLHATRRSGRSRAARREDAR